MPCLFRRQIAVGTAARLSARQAAESHSSSMAWAWRHWEERAGGLLWGQRNWRALRLLPVGPWVRRGRRGRFGAERAKAPGERLLGAPAPVANVWAQPAEGGAVASSANGPAGPAVPGRPHRCPRREACLRRRVPLGGPGAAETGPAVSLAAGPPVPIERAPDMWVARPPCGPGQGSSAGRGSRDDLAHTRAGGRGRVIDTNPLGLRWRSKPAPAQRRALLVGEHPKPGAASVGSEMRGAAQVPAA